MGSGARLLACAVVVVAGFAAASVAVAHNPGGLDSMYTTGHSGTHYDCDGSGMSFPQPSSDKICLNDNATMSFYFMSGMSPGEKNNVRSVLANEYDDTVLNPHEVTSPVWTGPVGDKNETDLILDEREMEEWINSPEYWGAAWCEDEYGVRRCDQSFVFLDISLGQFGPIYVESVACHEIGHTVGLVHPELASPVPHSEWDPVLRCLNNDIAIADFGWTSPGDHNKHLISHEY